MTMSYTDRWALIEGARNVANEQGNDDALVLAVRALCDVLEDVISEQVATTYPSSFARVNVMFPVTGPGGPTNVPWLAVRVADDHPDDDGTPHG